MLRQFKEITEFIFAAFYVLVINLFDKKPRRVVLYYHGINKADTPGFRRQMAYLVKNCSVVKPSQIKTTSTDRAKIVVAITFDDGFASILENAVPILKEHRLSAGIFVPTGNLGQLPLWEIPQGCIDKNEIIMSQQQVKELDNDGFEIFSHSFSHPILTEIDDEGIESELVNSKCALERIVGHEVSGISYPHGAYDDRVYKTAQKVGYKLGFTIEPTMVDSSTTDNLRIGRFRVSPKDRLIKFKLKVNGAYQVVSQLRKMKAKVFRK